MMTTEARAATLEPLGPYALRESVEFGFGQRHSERYDGLMRLAFVLDRSSADDVDQQVGVVVRQPDGDNTPLTWRCTGTATSPRSSGRWRGCSRSTSTRARSPRWGGPTR